jgi:phospholipid transport system transporter-binding protein
MPEAARPPAFDFVVRGKDLQLRGELVFDTARDAYQKLSDCLPRSCDSLAVDLSGIRRGDSAGLAVLVEWRALALGRGIHLRFNAAPDDLHALARLSDLDAELFV